MSEKKFGRDQLERFGASFIIFLDIYENYF